MHASALITPIATVLLVISGSAAQCLTENDARISNNFKISKKLYNGQQEFSIALLKEINNVYPQESIFFSPHSTYHVLLLAYFIAKSQTEDSLKSTLRIPETSDKLDVFQAYRLEKLTQFSLEVANDSYEFNLANRIYIAPDTGVRECMNEYFEQEIGKLDFRADPDAARAVINHWVENVTKDQIKEFLPEGLIHEGTNLVLVNAAYFKGIWVTEFVQTNKEDFFVKPNEKISVDMMAQESIFNHASSEELGADILELPYKGNDISMFIFLPRVPSETAVEDLLTKLNGTVLRESIRKGSLLPKEVQVKLPKFSHERKIEDMAQILKHLGVGDLFEGSSDLSGLTGQNNLKIGEAIHQAKIQLDEKGTVAAAASALVTGRSGRGHETTTFICNHPFIYFIYSSSSENTLFAGIFRKP